MAITAIRAARPHRIVAVLLVMFALPAAPLHAGPGSPYTTTHVEQPARIGILAFRSKADTLARWQPLIDHLNAEIPGVHFTAYALTNPEMNAAVAGAEIDFVFAQPSHYVMLTHTHSLSSPLATLVNMDGQVAVSVFGGVIFTRSDNATLNSLRDIRGKRVAVPDRNGLGGYQMQALELLQIGLEGGRDYELLVTGQPQDRVIEAVLTGAADAGFVRSGLLESMSAAGTLDSGRLKLIDPRTHPGFPFVTSTALYPEWPFAAMPHVDRDLARQVASVLLSLPHGGDIARRMQISGFTIPGDYRSIDHLLYELRQPPFDQVPAFTLREVWQRWQSVWLGLIALIATLLLLAVFRLSTRNRELLMAQHKLQASSEEIARLGQAVEQSPESIVITDLEGHILYVNRAFQRSTGYSAPEVLGHNPRLLKSTRTAPDIYREMWASLTAGQVWQGELINRRRDGSEFIESAIISPITDAGGKAFGYLAVKQDITERKHNEARIHQLAYYDSLTGLANRSRLNDLLARRLGTPEHNPHSDALLLVNIDRFKLINDARGHHLGDALLIALGDQLAALIDGRGTVARMGADEFAILLPHLGEDEASTTKAALEWAARMLACSALPLHVGGESITVTLSIGVASLPDPGDRSTADALRRADTALHRAKDGGGNQAALFETHMGDAIAQNFRIEAELRDALRRRELTLYLQPQTLPDGRLHGAEVLVRWQHPEEGLISPGRFIPVAEQSDLIVELSAYIFTAACHLLARMQAEGMPLRLAVNLSPRHFRKQNFIPWLKGLLADTGADPHRLTLEVTEGLFIDNLSETAARMDELCALGIHFSIDDFGTGYSSLAYLKRLPIRELKIDKGFIQDAPSDPDDAALVDAILAVAQNLHLEVVAEGIETPEQATFLSTRGRIIRQGYLFGRPEPAELWLQRWTTPPL